MNDSDKAAPAVSVVVVNYNGGDMLGHCLASIARQTFRDFRVFVVDNDSSDGSADVVLDQSAEFELIRAGCNLGFAAATNRALEQTQGSEWIALLNPDACAAPDWLERLMAAAHQGSFDFFGCRMRLAGNPELLDGTGDVYHRCGLAWRRDHRQPAASAVNTFGEIFAPCAAAALYKRSDLVAVGGFDANYFCYFEDVDLAFRLRLLGKRCAYVPDAVVDHVGSGIVGVRSEFATFYGQRNLIWTYVKNMPAPLMLRTLPLHLLINLVALVVGASRGQLGVVMRAKWAALMGLPRIWRARAVLHAQPAIDWRTLDAAMAHGLRSLWSRH